MTDADDREEKRKDERMAKFIAADIYNSVMVACYSGVYTDSHVRVHPAVLFIFSVMCFMVQCSVLMFLQLDLKLTKSVNPDPGNGGIGGMLLTCKVMMICIAQLMLFWELFTNVRLTVFTLNPSAWTHLRTAWTSTRGDAWLGAWAWHPAVLAILSIVAHGMQFAAGYLVCIQSVSIILACDTVTSVIFDSLAIIFIADLDETMWNVVSEVCHFMPFLEGPEKFVELPKELRPQTPTCLHARAGRAAHIEHGIAVLVMLFVYTRQVFIVLFALETNTLPAARDLCSIWRSKNGEWIVDHMIFFDVDQIVNWTASGICDDQKLAGMGILDMVEMMKEHPGPITCCVVIIAALLLLPSVVSWMLKRNDVHTYLSHSNSFLVIREKPHDPPPLGHQVSSLREAMSNISRRLQR